MGPVGARHGQRFARRTPLFRLLRVVERLLLTGGCVLLAVCLTAYVHRAVMFRAAMKSFEARHETVNSSIRDERSAAVAAEGLTADGDRLSGVGDGRVSSASRSRGAGAGRVPLAILRIPSIHLEAPVLGGTDNITLNRGVGQIAGTAAPGEKGNVGLAGHRDGFFRNLKDINQGDAIVLETMNTSETYIVDRILITGPDDVSVLQPRDAQSLTLVTCYPFYFIGPAPRRFIVEASLRK